MVKITPVFNDYHFLPIWSIENFWVPEISGNEETNEFDQFNEELLKTNNRIQILPIMDQDQKNLLSSQLTQVNDYILENAISQYDVHGLWLNYFNKLVPLFNGTFLCDKPNWKMEYHLDNRAVAGVLIINLVDNPHSTGTTFKHSYEGEVVFQAPTKKGTGVFFLNTHNMWHSIKNDSDRNRYVFYENFIVPIQ